MTTSIKPEAARPRTYTILALALLIRVLVLWFAVARFPHAWLFTRGIELGILAQSLLSGRGLSSPFGGSTGPTALLAPAYPAFIALVFRIFGSFTLASAITIMAAQLLFNLLTVLAMMHIAQRCFSHREANVAGTFWAVSLPLIWMPTIFWETCLSTLLLTGMVALSLHFEQGTRSVLWLAMGGYCGVAALVNPALLLPMLGMMAWVIWQARPCLPHRPLLGLLALVMVFAPWPIRNALALHAFIPLRSTVAFELWMGNRPGANGFLDETAFPLFNRREFSRYADLGEVRYMEAKSALARTYIEAHPAAFVRLSAVRFLRFWSGTGTEGGSAWFALHALLTTSLGAAGILRLWRRRRFSLAALFILPLLLFPLPYYVTHAEFRYRLVPDPLLTILAAFAVTDFFSRAAR
ncbi:MAG: hypothetical protein WA510_22245 [Acidobacteriaceae bacterium]